jgi:hypothetical protein
VSTELYFNLEAREGAHGKWWHLARVRVSQDYLLFNLLAGVRRDHPGMPDVESLPARGLPQDVTELTLAEDALTVDDEAAALEVPDACTRAAADAWVRDGRSRLLENGYAVTHPDFYSHSWLSSEDLRLVAVRYAAARGNEDIVLKAIQAALGALDAGGIESRAIIWFG